MSQQVYMQHSNKVDHRQNSKQQESQRQNLCSELQQELHSIRNETAKIKQEHLKLKQKIEQRSLELQEHQRTQKILNENLLSMHLQNENTRVKIKNKEEAFLKLMQKRSEVEEICTTIQNLCEPLSNVLIDIVEVKEEVTYNNNTAQENLEKLKEKFKHISEKSELLKQNLYNIALNEEQEIEKEKSRKIREITTANDNFHKLWNQLETSLRELNVKKEHINVAEKENINIKNENEHVLEELKKHIHIEENHYDSKSSISSSLIKEVEEMEMNYKLIVEEINQWESELSKLKSDLAELQLKSKVLDEEMVLKKKRYEEVHENALNVKAALEMCESEAEAVKIRSEEQDSKLHSAKEELQNTVCLNKEMEEEISKLKTKLEQKLFQVEEQKFSAARETEELKEAIKAKENELSNSVIDLQKTKELLTALEDQDKQYGELQMQIQQQNQQLQTERASNMEKLEELNTAFDHKNAEVERLFSLLTDREAELRQLTEDLDKAQRKYDETVSQREREKLEVDLELKNASREMEKAENNCHWIIQQTMACVDSCKQNYAKHVEDKKQELEACKSEKLHLAKKLSEVCAEKDECKIKLENEVMELEETVKELEIKLKQEIESNASTAVTKSPGAAPETQQKLQHSTTAPLEKETLPRPLEVTVQPEKNFKNKFFKTKLLPNIEEQVHNVLEDFDYYKFE